MSAAQELSVVPTQDNALLVFTAANGLDPYLADVRQKIDEFLESPPDMATRKGKDAFRSMAAKVARFKVAIEKIGKEQAAIQKEIPKKIDAERRRVKELLEKWQEEVRKPLTEWEEAEKARVAKHEAGIARMQEVDTGDANASLIGAMIQDLDSTDIGPEWEEYEAEAHRVKAASLNALRVALAAREKHEAEQAELEDLRRKQAEQEQKDREARIAQEAAEKARADAEQAAQAERDAAVRREAEAKAQADAREQQLKDQAAQAERDRIAAHERAEQAERDAQAKAEAAAEAERQRYLDEQKEAARLAFERESDKAHKASINSAALQAFIAGGMPEDCAKQAVILIAKKMIPNISITY